MKEAVTSAYKQVLSDKIYDLSAKEILQLAEKASSRTIDSLVQNTIYKSIPTAATEMASMKTNISASTASALTATKTGADKDKFAKDIEIKTSEAIYPIIEKTRLNLRYNYFFDLVMFTSLSVLSLLFAFLLKAEDKKKGYGLELPNIKKG